jgi:hypothetical protein
VTYEPTKALHLLYIVEWNLKLCHLYRFATSNRSAIIEPQSSLSRLSLLSVVAIMLPLHFSLYQSVLFCVHLQHVSSDFRRPPCRCYCSVPSCIAQTSGVGYTRSSRCDGLLMIPPLLIALFRLLQGEWSMLHKSFKM